MFEKVSFEGWPNCIRLYNKNIELIMTTDVGPRIIRFGHVKGQNLLYVSANDAGKSGGNDWRIYGGHRLWHAPEVSPRSYCPDNQKVHQTWKGSTLVLTQDIEATTGIVKEIEITLDPHHNRATVLHRLTNKGPWDIELAPWAITAMAPGGKAILPQEPYIDPADNLLPARPVVLWYYAQMSDPRFVWGNRYIQVKHDAARISEQKIGILNKQGWAAYMLNSELFVKKFSYDPNARYTDYGCNNEVYVNGGFLEVESLGPLSKIAPQGSAEHTEIWVLSAVEASVADDDDSLTWKISRI